MHDTKAALRPMPMYVAVISGYSPFQTSSSSYRAGWQATAAAHPFAAADNRSPNLPQLKEHWQRAGRRALQRPASVFVGPWRTRSSKGPRKNSCLDEKFIGNICVSLRNVSSFFPSQPVQVFGQFSLFVIQVVFWCRPFFFLFFLIVL